MTYGKPRKSVRISKADLEALLFLVSDGISDEMRNRLIESLHGFNGWQDGCRCNLCWAAERQRRHVRRRQREVRIQNETRQVASRHFYTWTSREMELLDDETLSVPQIARMTGRTFSAVKNKRRRYRIDPESATRQKYATAPHRLWTGPELELLARTDLAASQVAEMLGRTVGAVRSQRHLLRKQDPKKIWLAGVAS